MRLSRAEPGAAAARPVRRRSQHFKILLPDHAAVHFFRLRVLCSLRALRFDQVTDTLCFTVDFEYGGLGKERGSSTRCVGRHIAGLHSVWWAQPQTPPPPLLMLSAPPTLHSQLLLHFFLPLRLLKAISQSWSRQSLVLSHPDDIHVDNPPALQHGHRCTGSAQRLQGALRDLLLLALPLKIFKGRKIGPYLG